MAIPHYPTWVAGIPTTTKEILAVVDKYTGETFATVSLADDAAIEAAISAAFDARDAARSLPSYARRDVLTHCLRRFEERYDELALGLCAEAGKPIRDARGEVTRLIDTFRVAAEESVRQNGEVMTLEVTPRAKGYRGFWKRVPVGVCALITPFNFPLNLVAHKVAPAIASGCPFVLKPASATPIGALIVGEILAETEWPKGAFSILPCPGSSAERLVTDDRVALLSFTGSPAVGWALKAKAGRKKVSLELGGNAACVVEPDADLDDVVARIMIGAFYQSGQSCISVQRILIHETIYDELRDRLVAAASKLVVGDPRNEDTFIGPMISVEEAERVKTWIDVASTRGARVLCGGGRDGAFVPATLLENVPLDEPLSCREVFGPVATLSPYRDFDEALAMVNDSEFGLQAGVFTRDIDKAMAAWDRLEVGGVIIGDVPSWRVDPMPYGGVKNSGLGREGIRFAMEEMTEIRLMAVRTPPKRT